MKAGQSQRTPSSVPLWESSYGASLRKQANTPWPYNYSCRVNRGMQSSRERK